MKNEQYRYGILAGALSCALVQACGVAPAVQTKLSAVQLNAADDALPQPIEPQIIESELLEQTQAGSADAQPLAQVSAALTSFTERGSIAVSVQKASLDLNTCDLAYTDYVPQTLKSDVLVVLGHGFSRRMRHVAGIAEHIASFGVRVVTPDYCHSRFWDTDHELNGIEATELARFLSPYGAPVIYAGHSAGGLAAVVAASVDPRTLAVLGLDLTDKDNIALQAASGLVVTALGLVGEAGSCNAKGNGVAVFDALSQATALRINGAKHCDFEAPTTAFCTLPCGRQSAARAAQVRALAAAFVAWQAGADLSGREWVVSGGVGLAQWQQRGFVTVLP